MKIENNVLPLCNKTTNDMKITNENGKMTIVLDAFSEQQVFMNALAVYGKNFPRISTNESHDQLAELLADQFLNEYIKD